MQARKELQAEQQATRGQVATLATQQQGFKRQLRHAVARHHAQQGRADRLLTAKATAKLAAQKHTADKQVAALRGQLQEQGQQAASLKLQMEVLSQQAERQVAGLSAQLQASQHQAEARQNHADLKQQLQHISEACLAATMQPRAARSPQHIDVVSSPVVSSCDLSWKLPPCH